MTPEEFKKLNTGDTVRGKSTGLAYVVTANYGDRVSAVLQADITNPDEWTLVSKNEANKNRDVTITITGNRVEYQRDVRPLIEHPLVNK